LGRELDNFKKKEPASTVAAPAVSVAPLLNPVLEEAQQLAFD
jgi:hypothetical protein